MECDVCKNSKDTLYNCDGCRRCLCKLCGKLTSSEIKCLQLKERVMSFHCDLCSKFESLKLLNSLIEDKENLIQSKNKIIELLEKELTDLKIKYSNINSPTPSTYAAVASKHVIKEKVNLPCLIIKPNKHQECLKTKSEIEQKINPSKISVGINMIKNGRNGSILIKCNSECSTQKLKQEATKLLGSEYSINETKLRKPSVKIMNLKKDINEEEILESIVNQNEEYGFSTEDQIEVKVIKKNKNGNSAFAVIYCTGSAYNKFMAVKKINIGFEKCPVFENIHLVRCYKCFDFNHKIDECKQTEITCSKCCDSHSYKDCKSRIRKCKNCINYNEKYKTKFDVNHEVFSYECAVYKKNVDIVRERTNYKS